MRTRPVPRTFVGGELAPWLDGITNEVTAQGARTLENWIVMKQGPITRRPGSFYVAECKYSNLEAILIPVTIDDDHSYVIELGDLYLRVYENHAQVQSGGAAYEVVTPWSAGDVTDLRWVYDGEESRLIFSHPNHQLRDCIINSGADITMMNHSTIRSRGIYGIANYGMVSKLNTDHVLESYTGIQRLDDTSDDWRTISVSRDAVLAATYNGKIYRSEDLETWVQVASLGLHVRSQYLAFDGKGRGIHVGAGTTYATFDDGISWVDTTQSGSNNIVVFDSTSGYFRAQRGSGSIYTIDLINFTEIVNATSVIPYAGIFDGNGAMYLAGISSATTPQLYRAASYLTSSSLVYSLPNSSAGFFGIAEHDNVWVVVGGRGVTGGSSQGLIARSVDGTTFSLVMTSMTYCMRGVFWYDGAFVGLDFGGQCWISDTGLTWAQYSLTDPLTYAGIYFAKEAYDTNELFDSSNDYPCYLCLHERRLIAAATRDRPACVWGSATNEYQNYVLGDFADNSWEYVISGERNIDIKWVVSHNQLVIGTRNAEGVLIGSEDEGLTPSTAHMKWISTFGSDNVQPVRVGDMIVFVQRGGEIVRGLLPSAGDQAYKSPDLTQYADHIAEGGIIEFDHQDDPQTIVYAVRGDGQLLALTMEGNTIAWSRTVTDGQIESVAVIPTTGAEDEVWAVVKRVIGGSTKRFIEYFDTIKVSSAMTAHYVDCGYENAAAASGTIFTEVMPWLASEPVDVLVNGNIVEHVTLSASGTLTIATPGATHIHAGLPYISYAQTMRMESGSPWGTGQGLSKRGSGNLLVWVHDSIGGEFGPEMSITEAVAYDSTSDLTTDLLEVNFPGNWDRDGYVWCIQRDPLPMTIVAIAPDVEVGDR